MIGLVGLDHHAAPAETRGRLAFSGDRRTAAVQALARMPEIGEAAVLATCQRTEVYAAVTAGSWPAVRAAIVRFLRAAHDAGPAAPIPAIWQTSGDDTAGPDRCAWNAGLTFLYTEEEGEAARHLFRVAAGLRSPMLGETQILGQVREALAAAEAAGTLGAELRALFTHALRVGKRVRAGDTTGCAAPSVVTAALRTGSAMLEGLAGRGALVIGAGQIGQACVRSLHAAGIGRLIVANRSLPAAWDIAAAVGGEAVGLDEIETAMADVQLIVAATSAPRAVLTTDMVAHALCKRRRAEPLVIVDLAVPADVEPDVAGLAGVVLVPLDALSGAASGAGDTAQAAWMARAEALVEAGVHDWARGRRLAAAAEGIASIHRRVERAEQDETMAVVARLGHLSPDDRRAVEQFGRRLASRLFYEAVMAVRAFVDDDALPPDVVPAAARRLATPCRPRRACRRTGTVDTACAGCLER